MDEKGLNKSIKIKIIAVTALLLLMGVFGVSYAYFTVQVTGNQNASSIDTTAARLSLIYTDVQIIMGEYEQPGWTDTKVLTVENNGTDTVSYALKWRELENTVTNNELVISATCTSTSGSCSNIPETVVPYSQTEITNVYVYGPVSIAPGVKHTYTLTAHFKETGSNQNYNQNKYFNGTLNIDVDSSNYSDDWEKTYTVTFDPNGGSTTVNSKEVTVGFPYGELPTPTRAGYTFKGWNGRNLYNVSNKNSSSNGVTVNETDWININTSNGTQYYNYWTKNLDVDENKNYLFVVETGTLSNVTGNLYITSGVGSPNVTQFVGKSFTASSLASNSLYIFSVKTNTSPTLNYGLRTFYSNYNLNTNERLSFRISVMETSEAVNESNFTYEPYYIKTDTIVAQKHNHTLTAIWE